MMSKTDPLLQDLKACIRGIIVSSEEEFLVNDSHPVVEAICRLIESVILDGFSCVSHTPFGITKKDYWYCFEEISQLPLRLPIKFLSSIEHVIKSTQVSTSRGKGRMFIRSSLQNNCLHEPLELIVREKYCLEYYSQTSIIGDEILGEIFLSLILQLSQIKFMLNISNASFLDDTWQLPYYEDVHLDPCFDLGIQLGHINGRAIILDIYEGSVASEHGTFEVGDIIDYIYGVPIKGWNKRKIMSLIQRNRGLEIHIKLIKSKWKNGSTYPGCMCLHKKLNLNPMSSDRYVMETNLSYDLPDVNGHVVEYIGCTSVGSKGDVELIAGAIDAILQQNELIIPVAFVTGELGIQVIRLPSKNVLFSTNYAEMSSCGQKDSTSLFAYVAGNNQRCDEASDFTCYAFRANSVDEAKEILLKVADGFHRTHWAV